MRLVNSFESQNLNRKLHIEQHAVYSLSPVLRGEGSERASCIFRATPPHEIYGRANVIISAPLSLRHRWTRPSGSPAATTDPFGLKPARIPRFPAKAAISCKDGLPFTAATAQAKRRP